MSITLILTRTPARVFNHERQSGRWGQLIAVKGPKIKTVRLSPDAGSSCGSGFSGNGSVTIDKGVLQLDMEASAIAEQRNTFR